ncbi:glycosyltransferase, partial [bacterium]|nr:glycosyltransferase [bacterium]
LFPLLCLLTLFYCVILTWLSYGLSRLREGRNQSQPSVSIIIAARNEEKNIAGCLNALSKQSYPAEKYEIIIVDDRSQDKTTAIVKEAMKRDSHIRLIEIRETKPFTSPKKWAIDQGISQANGEIILTTDADCIVQTKWIETMIRHFEEQVGLVAGYSPLDQGNSQSLFHRFVELDALALAAVAAGSFGVGFPLTCTGRNLAYRKSAYQQISGFHTIRNVISGDDDLLLHKMKKKTEWEMRYAVKKQSMVSSAPPKNFMTFFHQRIRHASKSRYYDNTMKTGLIAVYLFNFSILVLVLSKFWLLFFVIVGIKSCFEFFLLFKAARLFQQRRLLLYYPPAAILHIVYVIIFGVWGQFGKFKWKETLYSSRAHSGM